MDTTFTEEELAFRAEVRTFFAEALDDDLKAKLSGGEASSQLKEGMEEWQRRLNAKGWMAPGWLVEFGGQNWTVTWHFIFNSERARAGAPAPVPFGVTMVAPVIYTYGTPEQKARFLPRILTSEDWWCQGYSEPGAGSDLASLQCRAERDGDEYVVNGSKIWTSFAQYANWIFCLVRTDNSGRKQDGISFLLIEMSTPGVTVRPIRTIDGIHHLNEVFFEDVRVPMGNRIGEEGKGWTYAKSLLYRAVCAADASDADACRSLLALKVMVGRAGRRIGGEAIQLHGGMGMTEELAVGFYVKRLMIANTLFGDADYQQQKFATLVNAPPESVTAAAAA